MPVFKESCISFLTPNQQCSSSSRCLQCFEHVQHAQNTEDIYYYYYNHFAALCLGLLWWAGTRRNIHPLTYPDHHPTFINFFHLLWSAASSLFNLFMCLTNLFAQPLSKSSLVYLLVWALHFILHIFLYPVSVFFLQHIPISCYFSFYFYFIYLFVYFNK